MKAGYMVFARLLCIRVEIDLNYDQLQNYQFSLSRLTPSLYRSLATSMPNFIIFVY